MQKKLDLNLLQTLEVLLAERNVTRAAERLNTTQPALSAQLARLRAMFDDPLLIPSSRGMTPTPRALALESNLGELMSGLRSVVYPQHFDPATSDVIIKVAATDATQFLLAPLIASLHLEAPNVHVAGMPVMRMSKPEIARLLATGEMDMVLGIRTHMPDDLRVRDLYTDEYVCAMRRDHPFDQPTMTLEEFCRFKHIFVSPLGGDFRGSVDDALQERGYQRNVVASVPSALVATRILETSDFVTVLSATMAERQSHLLKHYPLPIDGGKLRLVMAWHERTHLDPAHQWFRERMVGTLWRASGVRD